MAFTMQSDGVAFDFSADFAPTTENGFYKQEIVGDVPMPLLKKGDRLILPIDEGIALAVDGDYEDGEFSFARMRHNFCSREGTMSMVIVEREGTFLLITLESGVHASYDVCKQEGIYQIAITNHRPCQVYYRIFDSLPAACQAYRQIKNPSPRLLREKIAANPHVGHLVGGGIFWVWNDTYDEVMYADHDVDVNPQTGDDLLRVAGELKAGGVDKALFGIFFEKDSRYVETLYKTYGYMATQYDNYNDVLNPELLSIIPQNRVKNCDYTARRMKDYPDGVAIQQNGDKAKAWALKGFDGNMHSQNELCPLLAKDRMTEEVADILQAYPYYKGRFIDVYGGDLCACYHPAHPITRDECLDIKKAAFNNLRGMGLITGTEDGFEDLLDTLDYSEGLHSPVYFRIHNAGRRHANMYSEAEQNHIKKHMLDPQCRVPLWHLVYHECMPAFPYWGDTTDDCIEQLRDKILFACLYGCPPLYSFPMREFDKLKEHILFSYHKITAVHEKVATLPMTDYQVLTEDYALQTTVFGNKYRVVANFSSDPQTYKGYTIPQKDFVLIEL